MIKYQNQIKTDKFTIQSQKETISKQLNNLNQINTKLKISKNANKHFKFLGNFKITYYDLSYESCGKYPNNPAYGYTYSGAIAKESITIATDPNVIKLGSYIYIDGIGCRIAQDIGGAIKGNHIDVFVNDFSYEKYNTHYSDVWIIE